MEMTIAKVRIMDETDRTVARLSEGIYLFIYELKSGSRVSPNVKAKTMAGITNHKEWAHPRIK